MSLYELSNLTFLYTYLECRGIKTKCAFNWGGVGLLSPNFAAQR